MSGAAGRPGLARPGRWAQSAGFRDPVAPERLRYGKLGGTLGARAAPRDPPKEGGNFEVWAREGRRRSSGGSER